jgi:aminoglycoside phosphotransferase (APT) family kinase protein
MTIAGEPGNLEHAAVHAELGSPGSLVDTEAFSRFLREVPALAGSLPIRSLARIGSGQSNVTVRVHLSDCSVVLRRPPPGPLPRGAHDVLREFRVLSALAGSSVPVPRVFASCEGEAVLGVPFFVMEDLVGDAIRFDLPANLAGEQAVDRRDVGGQVVDALAALHTLDPDRVGLGELGRPSGYMARQLHVWKSQLDYARTRPVPDLDRAAVWLEEHLPPDVERVSIVHGDYKLDNAIFSHASPARLLGVVDWEMATLGDPLADLGWLLAFWRENGDDPPELKIIARTTELPGFSTRADLVERYAERMGRQLPDPGYYVAFAMWKMAVLLEGHWARHVRGTADEFDFSYLETAGPAYAARIARTIAELRR